MTLSDAPTYARPWTVAVKAELAADTELIEFVCNENNRSLEHWVGKASDERKTRHRSPPTSLRNTSAPMRSSLRFGERPPSRRDHALGWEALRRHGRQREGAVDRIICDTFSGLNGLGVEFIQNGSGGLFVKHVSGDYRFARK